jgi:hypothetical protein
MTESVSLLVKEWAIARVASGPCSLGAGLASSRMGYRDAEAPGAFTAVAVLPEVPRTSSSGSRERTGPSGGKSKTLRHLAQARPAGTMEFPSPAAVVPRHHGGAPLGCRVLSHSAR